MKLFDIFDQLGNKIGEVHEADNSLDGAGCVVSLLITLIMGVFIIFGWPMFFKQLFEGTKNSEMELFRQVLYLLIIVGVLIAHIVIDCKKKTFSFMGSWGSAILWVTVTAGLGYWVIAGAMEGFSVAYLPATLFLSFCLSIGGGFISSLLTVMIRRIRFKNRGK